VEMRLGVDGMSGTVVAGEDDQCAITQRMFFERFDDFTDASIEFCNHRSVCGTRAIMRQVTAAGKRLFVPLRREVIERGFCGMHRHVGFDKRHVEKERLGMLLVDEAQRLLHHQVGRVVVASKLRRVNLARFLGCVAGDGFGARRKCHPRIGVAVSLARSGKKMEVRKSQPPFPYLHFLTIPTNDNAKPANEVGGHELMLERGAKAPSLAQASDCEVDGLLAEVTFLGDRVVRAVRRFRDASRQVGS
jgi:hypothetical protein